MAEVSPSSASQFSSRRMGELRTAAAAKMTNAAASAPPLPAPDVAPPPPSSAEPARRTDSTPTITPPQEGEQTTPPVDPQEERRRKRADQVEQTRTTIVNARDSFIKRNGITSSDPSSPLTREMWNEMMGERDDPSTRPLAPGEIDVPFPGNGATLRESREVGGRFEPPVPPAMDPNDPPYPTTEQVRQQFSPDVRYNTGTPQPTDQADADRPSKWHPLGAKVAVGLALSGPPAAGVMYGAQHGTGGALIGLGAGLAADGLAAGAAMVAGRDRGTPAPEAGGVPPTRVDKTTSPSRRRFWPLGGSKPDATQAALDADIARMRTPDRTSNPGSAPIDIAPSALLTPPTPPAEASVPTLPTAPPVVPPEQGRSWFDKILRRNRAPSIPAEPVTLLIPQADQDNITGAGAPSTTRPEDFHLYQPPRTNVELGVPEPAPIIDPGSTSTKGEEV